MNEELVGLAADLQEVYHWEQDHREQNRKSTDIFVPIEPYSPSDTVKKQNEELVKYQQIAKNFSYGEY
ncbi:MAG: hypothetical protein LBC20_00075 [Planctomycetaceae bacterium]|jgi:hypothetical protein|nr:hypothetical protein [Planctomycetaceae bacterium]